MNKKYHPETLAIRQQLPTTEQGEHSVPLYLTSSYRFEDPDQMRAAFAGDVDCNTYSRYVNPNCRELELKLAALECTEDGFVTASGMSAIFSSFATFLSQGDHLVSCRSIFGSTHKILTTMLNRWGIEHTYVDVADPDSWEQAFQPNTKMVYIETPTNPGMDLVDLEWLGKLCKAKGVLLNVDNCFATPYLQQPAKFGADIVIHSATKYIDGQGRVLGGAVLGNKELIEEVRTFCRSVGPTLSAFNAWVLSKSMETLKIRMDKHCENALKLAQFLEGHELVKCVKYPSLPSHPQFDIAQRQMNGGGGIVTFYLKGGAEEGAKFLKGAEMCSLTANLGDTRTIVTHPASTTHSRLTEEERQAVCITPNLVRVSVGLEYIDDIIADIDAALKASAH